MKTYTHLTILLLCCINACTNQSGKSVAKANELYQKAVEINNRNIDTGDSMSNVLELLDDAISYNPGNVDFYSFKANTLVRQHKFPEAIKAMDAGLAVADTFPVLRTMRGMLKYQMGDTMSAYEDYKKSIAIYDARFAGGKRKNEQFDKTNRAFLFLLLGDTVRGKQEFENIKREFPDSPNSAWLYDGINGFDRDLFFRQAFGLPASNSVEPDKR